MTGSAVRQASQQVYRQAGFRLEQRTRFRPALDIRSEDDAWAAKGTEAAAAGTLRMPALRLALCASHAVAGAGRRGDFALTALPRVPGDARGHFRRGSRTGARPRVGSRAGAREGRLRAGRAAAHVPGASGPAE